jgi:hypothetical protein
VGIGIVPFWLSTFLGIFGVTVIHTTIGGGLDEMTSAADFHLFSFRNFMGLAAIVVGVLIPVGLRFYFKQEAQTAADADIEEEEEALLADDEERQLGTHRTIATGPPLPPAAKQSSQQPLFYHDEDEYEDEEDPIIEAGPAIVVKQTDEVSIPVPSSSFPSASRY